MGEMLDVLERVVTTKEAAHQAVTLAYQHAQMLLANGERVRITCGEDQDTIGLKQRRFLHGPVLNQISEQVVVNGERFVMAMWKEYFRKRFLGSRYMMQKLPGQKRATPIKERVSTEHLGDRAYSNYIDQVIDTAVVEFGVEFVFKDIEREEVRYVRKSAKVHG
jgi:hypothetical protein